MPHPARSFLLCSLVPLLPCQLVAPLCAKPVTIVNDAVWHATNGDEIHAQGGCILRFEDTYYWYGFDGDPPEGGAPRYKSVRCYSSRDLGHWRDEGPVLTDRAPNRLDVLHRASTHEFVMITKEMDAAMRGDDVGAGIAIAARPTGPFVRQGKLELPESIGGGDQSVFVDDDGRAYLVYTPWQRNTATGKIETNRHLICAELAPDFRRVTRVVCRMLNTRLEAPALFKRDGKYYWMASQVAWWYSSATSWCMASQLAGPWTPWEKLTSPRAASDPLAQQILADSYNSQHDFVLPVHGTRGTCYLYCGDRYSNFTTFGVGRVVWLPLLFDGDRPMLDWHQQWALDAATGTWSAVQPRS